MQCGKSRIKRTITIQFVTFGSSFRPCSLRSSTRHCHSSIGRHFCLRHQFTITGFLIVLMASSAPLPRAQQSSQQSILTADQYLQSADRYSSEKQYDKAVEAYKLAINLNPNLPAAYYGLGVAYVNMGRMPDALEPMRTAVRLAPTNANSHRVLGQILGHLQHFDDGLAEMYEARRLNPNDANVHNEID